MPAQRRPPSAVKPTDAAPGSGFSVNVHRGRHTRTLASSPAVTIEPPPEANTPEPTPPLCPLSTSTSMGCLAASSLHRRAVPSLLVDSRTFSDGWKLRLVTRPVWPRSDVAVVVPPIFATRTMCSVPAAAKYWPSALHASGGG